MIATPQTRPQRKVDFDHLLNHEARPSVSIFIGNDQPWPANKRSMLALKVQLKKVREQLEGYGLKKKQLEEFLAPLEPWIERGETWQNVVRSLAIYLSQDDLKIYEIDLHLKDSCHVGSVYDVRPLLPLVGTQEFYLLSLSQAHIHFLWVEAGVHTRLNVEGLPHSFEEYVSLDKYKRELQMTTVYASGAQKHSVVHGTGPQDFKKIQLSQFAKEIAQVVSAYLKGKSEPLNVIGLPPLSSMFLESNTYPNVLFVWEKDPTSFSEAELVDRTRKEYVEWSMRKKYEVTEKALAHHVSKPQAESRVAEIVKRAQQGEVKRLFIRQQDYVWGNYEPATQKVEVLRAHLLGTEDLLNRAAIYTLQNGGEVYLFDPIKFQAPEHALAVLKAN